MKSHIGLVLIFLIISSLFASYVRHYEEYYVSANTFAIISGYALWIWMLVDLINRKNIEKKFIWVVLFFVFTFITSIFYYIFIFYPKQEGNLFQKFSKKLDSRLIYLLSLVAVAFIVTCSHYFIMSTVYLTFGIPFPNLYTMIVSNGIYAPFHFVLDIIYKLMELDLNKPPDKILSQIVHIAVFAYTMLLYSMILLVGQKTYQAKRASQQIA